MGKFTIKLVPLGISVEAESGAALGEILAPHGVELPCGGTSLCGGCRVRVLKGHLAITEEDRASLSPDEIDAGWRLACRARVTEPICLQVEQWTLSPLGDDSRVRFSSSSTRDGITVAVDLGTTTVVVQSFDLRTGELVGIRAALNPQSAWGSDVVSRIRFAMNSSDLTSLIRKAVGAMVEEVATGPATGTRGPVREVLLVGNTVMHHLFCGLDVAPLSHVPFESPALGTVGFSPGELGWALPASCRIRFLQCVGGYVGSDLLAGVVACGMDKNSEITALVDLGTNAEIALGNRDRILCASTAAGPAFEGGEIRRGMRASTGAISSVTVVDGKLHTSVIGAVAPRGICGSGLVDGVAAGLELGMIVPSGRLRGGMDFFAVAGDIGLYQRDIRQLQLAKGAIACGFELLLKRLGASLGEVKSVFLAGAFGNYVRAESAVRIGLLPGIAAGRLTPSGNTALRGAKLILSEAPEREMPQLEHVALASEPDFENAFVSAMTLG
jgi:uncharacterized 2Fe-2S/4Fe-4S cluster protein (DUF4445 family)